MSGCSKLMVAELTRAKSYKSKVERNEAKTFK